METLTETKSVIIEPARAVPAVPVTSNGRITRYGLAWQASQFESARFGWMSILMAFQSCLGGVACLFISLNGSDWFALSTCAAVTMGSNAVFIALASPRVCLLAFYASVLFNTLASLYYV